MALHLQNLHKNHAVARKNKIDTKIQNTEQLVRKMISGDQP